MPWLPNTTTGTTPSGPTTISVPNYAAARALIVPPITDVVEVAGRTSPGDGGGGSFAWDPTSTAADDDGTVLKITSVATGRLLRIFDNEDGYNVKWFGAIGDGATNDTVAIQACLNVAASHAQSGIIDPFGTILTGTTSTPVQFPQGVYRITSGLTTSLGLEWVGFRSIIIMANYAAGIYTPITGTDIVSGTFYNNRFEGITFRYGRRVFNFATGNVWTWVRVYRCIFDGYAGDCIYSDDNSPSTSVRFEDCQWLSANPAARVYNAVFDDAEFINPILVTNKNVNVGDFKIRGTAQTAPSRLYIESIFSNPLDGNGCYVENLAGFVTIAGNSRFGGENGGRIIIDNSAPPGDILLNTNPTGIVITGSVIADAPHYLVRFFEVPNLVQIDGQIGTNAGLWFADTATALAAIQQSTEFRVPRIRVVTGDSLDSSSASDFGTINRVLADYRIDSYGRLTETMLLASDLMVKTNGDNNYGAYRSIPASMNEISTAASFFGQVYSEIECVSGPGSYTTGFTELMDGFVEGAYTLVIDQEVLVGACNCIITIGGTVYRQFDLSLGRHVLAVPFYWDPAVATNNTVQFAMDRVETGTKFRHNLSYRIFQNHQNVKTVNSVCYSDAPPVNGRWLLGDEIINTGNGDYGWKCVTAGYVATTLWAASTVEHTGATVITSAGRVYECTATTGDNKTGLVEPTNTSGSNFTDGNVTWRYVGNQIALFAPIPVSAVQTISIPIGTSATYDSTNTLPAGAQITECRVKVTTPYSAGATLTVGQPGHTSDFMTTADSDITSTTISLWIADQITAAATTGVVRATISGAPGAGAGEVMLFYTVPLT